MTSAPKPVSSVTVFRENKFLQKIVISLIALVPSLLVLKSILLVISVFFGGISSGSSANLITGAVPVPKSGFCSDRSLGLSANNPHIEYEQARDCKSVLVDIPEYTEFDCKFPGYTEIYECKNDPHRCVKRFAIPDLDGRQYPATVTYPRSFRSMGKPGKVKCTFIRYYR